MKLNLSRSLNLLGIPTITLKINDEMYLNFIIDTGADNNYIRQDIAIPYAKVLNVAKDLKTGNGITKSEESREFSFSLNEKSFTESFDSINPCSFVAIEEETQIPIHGILGYPFLLRNQCKIDYKRGTITIRK